jgi:hypothetical protein
MEKCIVVSVFSRQRHFDLRVVTGYFFLYKIRVRVGVTREYVVRMVYYKSKMHAKAKQEIILPAAAAEPLKLEAPLFEPLPPEVEPDPLPDDVLPEVEEPDEAAEAMPITYVSKL